MRKTTLLLCSLAVLLSGCRPKDDTVTRAREERPYPDPALGTENSESQWYKTQILASPSAPSATTSAMSAAAPAKTTPAKLSRTPVATHAAGPGMSPGKMRAATPGSAQ